VISAIEPVARADAKAAAVGNPLAQHPYASHCVEAEFADGGQSSRTRSSAPAHHGRGSTPHARLRGRLGEFSDALGSAARRGSDDCDHHHDVRPSCTCAAPPAVAYRKLNNMSIRSRMLFVMRRGTNHVQAALLREIVEREFRRLDRRCARRMGPAKASSEAARRTMTTVDISYDARRRMR